jgi:hypothetical protein
MDRTVYFGRGINKPLVKITQPEDDECHSKYVAVLYEHIFIKTTIKFV